MRLPNVPSPIATAGLVVLLSVDVVLIGAAVRSTQSRGIDSTSIRSDSAFTDAMSTPAVSPTRAPENATSAASASAVPVQVMLAAVDTQRAWRVTAGSCAAGGAKVTRTTDGGRTWTAGLTHLDRILRVRSLPADAAFVIGTNTKCAAELRTTSNKGTTWSPDDYLKTLWYRDPQTLSVLHAPGPAISKPCGQQAVLDLAVDLTEDSARVVCVGGLVRSSTNAGSSWSTMGTVPGAAAVSVTPAKPVKTYVARLGAPNCAGLQILRVGQSVATACIRTSLPKGPGQIALSLVKGGGWLAVGDKTLRSTDNLVTWNPS